MASSKTITRIIWLAVLFYAAFINSTNGQDSDSGGSTLDPSILFNIMSEMRKESEIDIGEAATTQGLEFFDFNEVEKVKRENLETGKEDEKKKTKKPAKATKKRITVQKKTTKAAFTKRTTNDIPTKQTTKAIITKKTTKAILTKKTTKAILTKKSTKAKVAKKSTKAKVAKKSTKAKVAKKSTKAKVAKKSTKAKVAKKSTKAKVAKKSTKAKVAKKSTKAKVAKKSTKAKVAKKSTKAKVAKKSTKAKVAKKSTKAKLAKKSTKAKVAKKSTNPPKPIFINLETPEVFKFTSKKAANTTARRRVTRRRRPIYHRPCYKTRNLYYRPQCRSSDICTRYNAPAYRTFDGGLVQSRRPSSHIIAQSCHGSVPYRIIANQDRYSLFDPRLYVKSINVQYNGIDYLLSDRLRINGQYVPFPYVDNNLRIYGYKNNIVFDSDLFNLKYDSFNSLKLRQCGQQVEGLCGNNNRNPFDDNINTGSFVIAESPRRNHICRSNLGDY